MLKKIVRLAEGIWSRRTRCSWNVTRCGWYRNTDLWLDNTDHVTWILACDWSQCLNIPQGQGSINCFRYKTWPALLAKLSPPSTIFDQIPLGKSWQETRSWWGIIREKTLNPLLVKNKLHFLCGLIRYKSVLTIFMCRVGGLVRGKGGKGFYCVWFLTLIRSIWLQDPLAPDNMFLVIKAQVINSLVRAQYLQLNSVAKAKMTSYYLVGFSPLSFWIFTSWPEILF